MPCHHLTCVDVAGLSIFPGKTTIGFVGMGILGVPMSLNLLKAGYKVIVHNRNSAKCDPVLAAGGVFAASPREVVELATYTFATLSGVILTPSQPCFNR